MAQRRVTVRDAAFFFGDVYSSSLRAERKAGALLAEMEKAKASGSNQYSKDLGGRGGRPPKNEQTLASLGVSKEQSSNWPRLAAVLEDEFEGMVALQVWRPNRGLNQPRSTTRRIR